MKSNDRQSKGGIKKVWASIGTALKSFTGGSINPSTYKGGGFFHWLPDGTEVFFEYANVQSSLKAYTECAPIAAIINRKAQAYINGKTWVMKTSGKGKENEAVMIDGMDSSEKEFLLNLPLYDGVETLEVGTVKGSTLTPCAATKGSIVFYGTSITQGAAASRPGMTYTALLSRSLNKNVINLGFSGNGFFDPVLAPYILSANPELIVLECTPNSHPDTIGKNLPRLLSAIRAKNGVVPVLLVESITRIDAYHKRDKLAFIQFQNKALKQVYEHCKDSNLHYLTADGLIGRDGEATVDGTHFTDLGFYRYYEGLKGVVKGLAK